MCENNIIKKVCCFCKIEKTITEFKPRKNRNTYTYTSRCVDCLKLYSKEHHNKNKLKPLYVEQNPTRTKVCLQCNEIKTIVEFPLANYRTGSYLNTCKYCDSKNGKLYNETIRKPKRTSDWYVYVNEKTCRGCSILKPINAFTNMSSSKDGKNNMCKDCASLKKKKYRKENKEYIKESNKKYKENNSDKIKQRQKALRETNEQKEYQKQYRKENKERLRLQQKEYQQTHKESIRAYQRIKDKERRENDPNYNIQRSVKTNLMYAFKNHSLKGKQKTTKEYGIDVASIITKLGPRPSKAHHLDHILPVAAFNFDNPEHVRLCHLPENLRWLPGKENIDKRDTIIWSLISSDPILLEIATKLGLNESHDGMNARLLKQAK